MSNEKMIFNFHIIFTVLWIADTVFSAIFVHLGGSSLEANVLMAHVFDSIGIFGFVSIKLLLLTVYWALVVRHSTMRYVSAFLSGVMIYPVVLGYTMAVGLM